jgi:hypothetical protein
MQRIIPILIVFAISAVTPAQAQDNFTPRLISAIQDYLRAYEVCLRRVIAASPTVGKTPEHIAAQAVKTCKEKDPEIRVTKKRVYGFPSVDNFMAGTSERIFAFAADLATAHLATKSPR